MTILRRIAAVGVSYRVLVDSISKQYDFRPFFIKPIFCVLPNLLCDIYDFFEGVVDLDPDLAVDAVAFAKDDLTTMPFWQER